LKILVTGGLGYLGSHVVVDLLKNSFSVVIIDNLINSDISSLDCITNISNKNLVFEKLDLTKEKQVEEFFNRNSDIEGVIHFAALKSVRESIKYPLKYYHNNVTGMILLLEYMPKGIPFVFSSSCTVYGAVENNPIDENTPYGNPQSPYAHTKQICEIIMNSKFKSEVNFKGISLRYFNPIGAHPSGLIGENPKNKPENLVPYLTQVVSGRREELTVFGNDYLTIDGTCIRDYIHVMDLADSHIAAINHLNNLKSKKYLDDFNIGTGKGISVIQLIKMFEESTGKKVQYKIGKRRPGDLEVAYANTKKTEKILGWKSKYTLDEALQSAWNWELNHQ
tara:strand:+ start:8740 stop:9747 length:1008 start_codon:yes stop_codon:yes gene_type:complete